ncbi:MAG: hypothetical protein ABIO44_04115 [Saprospiraceae bacterium]
MELFQKINNIFISNKNKKWNLNPLILRIISISYLFSIVLNSQSSWTELSGPNEVDILASYISKNGQIYQYTSTKEIFISYDQGNNWTSNSIGLIKADDTCYTSNYFFKESPDGHIYFHGGCILYRLNTVTMIWDLINRNINLIDLCFSKDGSNIFAGDYYNLYLSIDSGKTFISKFYGRVNDLELYSFGKDSNIVEKDLGAKVVRYKFDDNINTFSEITSGGGGGPILFAEDTRTLYSFESNKFAKSEDFGKTWHDFKINNSNGVFCYYATFYEDRSILLFGKNNYRSHDSGVTWQIDSTYESFGNFNLRQKISISNGNDLVSFYHNQSILLSPHKKLNYLNIPIPKPFVLEIIQASTNTIICRTNQTLQISLNDGLSWKEINRNIDLVRTFKNGDILAVNNTGFISYTQDQGITWKEIPFVREIIRPGMNFFVNTKDEILLIAYDSIYLSQDKGISWNRTRLNLKYGFELPKLSANDVLYSRYGDSIYYSTDFGQSVNKFKADNANRNNYCYLSKNNVFYWIREDFWTEDLEIIYSKDFGNTRDIYIRKWPDQLLLIDDDDNIYICYNNWYPTLNILSLINNNSFKIYSFNGINKPDNYCVDNLTLGQDHHLYCSIPYQPLYRTNAKINTDPVNINKKLTESENQLSITKNSQNTTISLPDDWNVNQSHILIVDNYGKQLSMYSKQLNKIIINHNVITSGIYYFQIFNNSGKHLSAKLLFGM